jgi:glycosyltransferase involved in cell wall biosynthesis
MLGTHHSWAITMRNLLTQFQEKGHKIYIKSANGNDFIPPNLMSRLDRDIAVPDIDISYTLPRNFKQRMAPKAKLKLGIYNYESSAFPKMWLQTINDVDYLLPSSNFSRDIFIEGGWPADRCIVIPNGINLTSEEKYNSTKPYGLKSKKKFKFLNVSIPHYRKNIDMVVESYYKTFSGKDDVCLVLKTSLDKPKNPFEINLAEKINELVAKYKDKEGGLPEVEIVTAKLDDMLPLYKACQVLVSATSSEGFGIPLLEALDARLLVIAPRCTGQLDFLNDENALLVESREITADVRYQYWIETPGAKTFLPKQELLCHSMIIAHRYYEKLLERHRAESLRVCQDFTWERAAHKILEIKK